MPRMCSPTGILPDQGRELLVEPTYTDLFTKRLTEKSVRI